MAQKIGQQVFFSQTGFDRLILFYNITMVKILVTTMIDSYDCADGQPELRKKLSTIRIHVKTRIYTRSGSQDEAGVILLNSFLLSQINRDY